MSTTGLAISPPSFFDSPFQRQRRLGLGQGLVQRDQRQLTTATTFNAVPMVNQYGGTIMATTMTKAIFWGPTWANRYTHNLLIYPQDIPSHFLPLIPTNITTPDTPSTNTNKIAGLNAWYAGYGLSSYANTVSEYASTGTTVYPSLHTYTGHIVDFSAVRNNYLSRC